jgi:hypothetical protein
VFALRFIKRCCDSTLKLESDSFNYTSVYSRARNPIRNGHKRRYHSPRGLRRGSAAARLLGLRVRFQLGAWMFVFCVVFSGGGFCDGPIPLPEDSYRVCVSLSMIRNNNSPVYLQRVGKKEVRQTDRQKRKIVTNYQITASRH